MRRAKIVCPWLGAGTTGNAYRPNVIVESWNDTTGQTVPDIITAKPPYTIEIQATDAQMTTIAARADCAVLWNVDSADTTPIADLDAAGLAAIKAQIDKVYYSDVVELVTQGNMNPDVIASDLAVVQRRPPWKAGMAVSVGAVYQYTDGNIYECIQSHTTQSDWTPPVAKALWKRFYEPSNDPWPWVQPTGAHDAYPIGARVTHNGYTWQNTIAANVWEPGVTGWLNLTPPPPVSAWSFPVAYKVNDQVTYNGHTYKCLQAHTSQAAWTPPAVPALWQLII